MKVVSDIVNLAGRVGGPRLAFQLQLTRLRRWRKFEREFYLLDRLVDPERVAIDVGANQGFYAARLAQLTRRVHCFEPIPELANELRRKLNPRVTVHDCALSDIAGKAELRIPGLGDPESAGYATIEKGNSLNGKTVRRISCETAPLNDLVTEPVGFIKIDVEGHELAVLKGASKILDQHRPVLLIESERRHNPEAPENVFRFLADLDYQRFFFVGPYLFKTQSFNPNLYQRSEDNGRRCYINNFIFFPAHP